MKWLRKLVRMLTYNKPSIFRYYETKRGYVLFDYDIKQFIVVIPSLNNRRIVFGLKASEAVNYLKRLDKQIL